MLNRLKLVMVLIVLASTSSNFSASTDDALILYGVPNRLSATSPVRSTSVGTNHNDITFCYKQRAKLFEELSQRLLIRPFDATSINEEFDVLAAKGIDPGVVISAMVDIGMQACNTPTEDKANIYILRLCWFLKKYLFPISAALHVNFATAVGKKAADTLFEQIGDQPMNVMSSRDVETARTALFQVFRASASQYQIARYSGGKCEQGNEIPLHNTYELFERIFIVQVRSFLANTRMAMISESEHDPLLPKEEEKPQSGSIFSCLCCS